MEEIFQKKKYNLSLNLKSYENIESADNIDMSLFFEIQVKKYFKF